MGDENKTLYETNGDFRDYVEKYRRTYGLTLEQALQHACVREAAKYYRDKETEEATWKSRQMMLF